MGRREVAGERPQHGMMQWVHSSCPYRSCCHIYLHGERKYKHPVFPCSIIRLLSHKLAFRFYGEWKGWFTRLAEIDLRSLSISLPDKLMISYLILQILVGGR